MAATSSFSDPIYRETAHRPPHGEAASLRAARARSPKRQRWLRMVLATGLAFAGLSYMAQDHRRTGTDEAAAGPPPAAALIAPPPAWRPVAKATALYAIEGNDGKPLPASIDARRHAEGGREDTLTFGEFGMIGYARLSVTRGPVERQSPRFYVDFVRHAAAIGLSVVRSAQSEAVATKFGPVEVATVTLAETVVEGLEQSCLAFRFAQGEPAFGFQGWLCGAQAVAVTTGQLACFVDRLGFVGGDDPALKGLFAQADRRRIEGCAPTLRATSARKS